MYARLSGETRLVFETSPQPSPWKGEGARFVDAAPSDRTSGAMLIALDEHADAVPSPLDGRASTHRISASSGAMLIALDEHADAVPSPLDGRVSTHRISASSGAMLIALAEHADTVPSPLAARASTHRISADDAASVPREAPCLIRP